MNEISKARIKFFGLFLVVACVISALVYLFAIVPGRPEKPAEPQQPETPPEPPKPVYVYRVPSTSPTFGTPFHYETAVDGNLKNLPLSQGATSGFFVDLDTRNVLWMKTPRRSVPVASMVKMMTLLLAFEGMEADHSITLDSSIQITNCVTQVGKSGIIWLDPREMMPLRDLLMAVTIKSANDAAQQVAEVFGKGSVADFIARMNDRAISLGMPGTMFVSPNGLKSKQHGNSLSSAEGMVILGERLLEYPPVMEWASTKQAFIQRPFLKQGKTELTNTNKLILPHYPGVDGLKTGYTQDAGSCLTFTALRNGRRLMGCVTGFSSSRDRDNFVRKLIDWGYGRTAEIDAGKVTPPAAGPVTSSRQR